MATVQDYGPWESPIYREFANHFDAHQRQALVEEDLQAGRSVSLVLVSVVAAGAIGMLLTVLATLML